MLNQELIDYIKDQINKGVSELQIRNNLYKNGKTLEEIQIAFEALSPPQKPLDKPINTFKFKKLSNYGLYLILVGTGVLSLVILPKLIMSSFISKDKLNLNTGVLVKPTDIPILELPNTTPTSIPVLTKTLSPTLTKPTVRPTAIPSKKITPKPTSPPVNSNPYNLTSATGSVKVHIRPQNGVLVGDQIVELHAIGGYKVLVNQSTDMDTRIARQGEPVAIFSSVPAGPYYAKVRYKADWTGNYNLNVNSGNQTTVDITVSGDAAPTSIPTLIPTQVVKPRCSNPVIYPSSTGTAPFAAILQPQGESSIGIAGYEWDLDNNGSYEIPTSPNAQNYTFTNPGSYTVVMRVVDIQGNRSDPCSTTVTVN